MKNKNFIGRLRCLLFLMALASFNYLSAQTGPNDDFDGDGIINSIDIDDDNDGVPDAVESPSCFYLASEWNTAVKPSNGVVISSGLTTTTSNFGQLLDNVPGTNAVAFTTGQAIQNTNVYLFTFDHAVRLDALYLKFNTATQFVGNTKIQGSNTNNGADWVDLSAAIAPGSTSNVTANGGVTVANSMKYPVTLNTTTAYKYIRITGVTAATTSATVQNASEVYFDFNIANYVASYYPKATCTDANIDGDGMLPHFDLDSDGDGCSDAYEAGATTNLTTNYKFTGAVGANGLDNTLETSDNGIINYTSTYHAYALSSAIQVCKDTDGDGILDINDIDDDNDGIPDVDEQTRGACNTTNCTSWVSPQSTGAGTSAPATVMVDGQEVSYTITTNTSFTQQSAAGYTLQCSGAAVTGIPYWQRVDANNQTMTFNFSKPVTNFQIVMAAIETAPPGLIESIQVTTNNSTGQQTICESCNKSGIVTIDGQNLTVLGNGTGTEIFNVNGPTFTSITIKVTSVGGAYLMSYGLCALKTYSSSLYTDIDTDGDGIPNRLDLDSDGDGCPDLKEAKVTPLTDVITASATNNVGGSYGIANPAGAQLNPAATDVNNDGLNDSVDSDVNGSPDYSSTYNPIALSKAINLCSDMDGDGTPDLIDIDDDNDGITDIIESPTCFYTLSDLKSQTNITSDLSFTSSTQPFSLALDNNTATWADIDNAIVIDKNLIEVSTPLSNPIPLSTVTVQIGINNAFPGSSFQLQGWTGNSWEAMSATQAMATANTTYTFTNTLHPTKAYNKFRIRGLAGYVTNGTRLHEITLTFAQPFVSALQPKAICTNDTDGDSIYNHQDLDSDGDGCSDLLESGVSPSTDVFTPSSANNNNGTSYGIDPAKLAGSQLNPAATDANNDGLNDSVDTDLNGITNYTSTYNPYAIGSNFASCLDSDGDGILDINDIDDDNDGILDAVESPSCFYTETEARSLANGTVTSDFTWSTTNPLINAYDGTTTNIAWAGAAVTNIAGLSLVDLTLPIQKNILISNVQVAVGVTALSSSTSALWQLEGWNGTAWIALSAAQHMNTVSFTYTFSNTLQPTVKYARYRIAGTSTTAGIPINGRLVEVYVNYNNYISSAYPKPTCTNDTDGDGIPNHLDIDSDGDGCSDAMEGGATSNLTANYIFTGPVGANGLDNSLETADNGVVNYTSTYSLYAINASIKACTDTDGDGVVDIIDIDDDNDGVLDTVECGSVASAANKPAKILVNTTNEDFASIRTGLMTEVNSYAPAGSTITSNLTLENSTVSTNYYSGYDIVIIEAVAGTISQAHWDALASAITNNKSTSFIFMIDGCCSVTNMTKLTNLLNIVYGTSYTLGTRTTSVQNGPINPNSSYADVFTSIWSNPYSADYTPILGVASSDVLAYSQADPTGAFMFMKQLPNTVDRGHYMYVSTDATITQAGYYPQNAGKIIPAFNAAVFNDYLCNNDTDNDGIPNRLDLDSDGDGCPDTKEAILYNHVTEASIAGDVKNGSGGAVTSTVNMPNAMVPGPYGSNGFADALQLSTNPDAYKYVYTYNFVANNVNVSTCDNKFLYDIDSDDDGIPDAVESPTCFYTETQAMNITEGVTSDFAWAAANPLSNTYDDNTTYGAVTPAVNIQNKSLITFDLPVIDAAFIDYVQLNVGATAFGTGTWRLEGLDVNTNLWVSLSAAQAMSNINSNYVFTNTLQSNTRYHTYRILGVTSVNVTNSAILTEFSIHYKNYNPSFHRTKMGCNSDGDNDGVPDYLDRDSDGDGCPDAVEAGIDKSLLLPSGFYNNGGIVNGDYVIVGGNYGNNGISDLVETTPDSGIINYASTYHLYANNAAVNFCTDTDNDGVPDPIDFDDDNDGVLDAVESPSCFYTAAEANVVYRINSQFASPDDDQSDRDIQMLHDGNAVANFNFNAFTVAENATGSNLFTVEYFTSVRLATLVVSNRISTTANANAVVVGSQDGVMWSAALTPATLITAANATTPITFTITTAVPYKFYKIQTGSVPGALATANTIGEITSTLASGYIPSAHPKSEVCLVDTDGDLIPNHHDLDSDGDGCPDAVESGVSVNPGAAASMFTSGGSVYTGGIASGTANAYVGNGTPGQYNSNGFFNDIETGENGIYNGTYTYANAINALVSNCITACYKPAITAGTVLDTKQGITSLQRAGTDNSNWPMVRKGAWTVLESKTKGFVPNRLTVQQIADIPVADLREGMMVYHIGLDCLYINTNGTPTGWKCFNTQTCP